MTAPSSNGVTYNGDVIRRAFERLLAGSAENSPTGASATSADQMNINFGYSNPSYFGGDQGTSEKREADPEDNLIFQYGFEGKGDLSDPEPWIHPSQVNATTDAFNFVYKLGKRFVTPSRITRDSI